MVESVPCTAWATCFRVSPPSSGWTRSFERRGPCPRGSASWRSTCRQRLALRDCWRSAHRRSRELKGVLAAAVIAVTQHSMPCVAVTLGFTCLAVDARIFSDAIGAIRKRLSQFLAATSLERHERIRRVFPHVFPSLSGGAGDAPESGRTGRSPGRNCCRAGSYPCQTRLINF